MKSIPLWDGPAPFAKGSSPADIPTLDIYEPFGNVFRDCAVVILPGGGYGFLSGQEGEGFAGLFQLWGFHAFVCNYRLGTDGYRHPTMLTDASRAVRIVRSQAADRGYDPKKIVIIGSSAGGHLAATVLTQWIEADANASDPIDRESSRPDLGILCYPVITMGDFTHKGSQENLLGVDAEQAALEAMSAEKNVTAQTPQTFIWHTYEDGAVPVENAVHFASALRKAGVPFELHIYQDGGHGLGMKDGIPWVNDCFNWLQKRLKS